MKWQVRKGWKEVKEVKGFTIGELWGTPWGNSYFGLETRFCLVCRHCSRYKHWLYYPALAYLGILPSHLLVDR